MNDQNQLGLLPATPPEAQTREERERALDRQIDDVLCGRERQPGVTPAPLDKEARAVLRALRRHRGHRLPITLQDLIAAAWRERGGDTRSQCEWAAFTERDIKAIVKSLIEDHGIAIGASRQPPYGYFLIVTPDDLEIALRPLVHEGASIFRRVKALAGRGRALEYLGQLQLAANDEPEEAA